MTTPQDLAAQIEALAPCPFCGGEARTQRDGDPSYPVVIRDSHNEGCPLGFITLQISYKSEADAAEAWNNIPAIVAAIRQGEGKSGIASDMAAALRNTPAQALREAGYLDRAADMLDAIAQQEMAAFCASDAACYLYPDEEQQPERAAFCAGAAHSAPPPAPDERNDEVRKALVQLVRALECVEAGTDENAYALVVEALERLATEIRALAGEGV